MTAVLAPALDLFESRNGFLAARGIDLTPYAFTFSGLAIAWGIYRFRMFDLTPLARDLIVDSLGRVRLGRLHIHRLLDDNCSLRSGRLPKNAAGNGR